jgi:predicted N-formylglutamate amidohydrolase
MKTGTPAFVITCEHGGNTVPSQYEAPFRCPGAQRALQSHRGYDPGSLVAAEAFAMRLEVPLVASTTTRLLVDLNRCESSESLFSSYALGLSPECRAHVLEGYYFPYREQVVAVIEDRFNHGLSVIHISMHSFVNRFRSQTRTVDVGLLFDPGRPLETALCTEWLEAFGKTEPNLRALPNEPYAGTDDGLTTTCRQRFPADSYLGIEVEINNRFSKRSPKRFGRLVSHLIDSLPRQRVDPASSTLRLRR